MEIIISLIIIAIVVIDIFARDLLYDEPYSYFSPHIIVTLLNIVYIMSRQGLPVAFSFNRFVGIILSLIIAFIIIWLFVILNRITLKKKFPPYKVLCLFVSVILFGTSLFGAISYSLFQANIAVYEPQKEINIIKLSDFYLWYFVDMIPGLDIWKTLNVQSPIEAQGTWARVPILLFRLFVAIPAIWLVKRYIDFEIERRGKEEAEMREKEEGEIKQGVYLGKKFYNKGHRVDDKTKDDI